MDGTIWIKDMTEVRRSGDHRQNLGKDEEIRKEKKVSGKRGVMFSQKPKKQRIQGKNDGWTSIFKWLRIPKYLGLNKCPLDLAIGVIGKATELSIKERLDFLRGNTG